MLYFLINRRFMCFLACLLVGASPSTAGLKDISDVTLAKDFSEWGLGVDSASTLRPATDKWDSARVTARTKDDWAGWLGERKRVLDRWMLAGRERHELPVGWAHDYVDQKTGGFLKWSPESTAPAPGSSEKVQAAWLMFVRSYNIGQVLEAARFYRLREDVQYRDWAIAQLDSYAANYVNLPLQSWNGESRLFYQALDEAIYCFQLLEAVRLLRPYVDKLTLERWQRQLFAPMADGLIRSSNADHNIVVWISAAVSAIGAEFDLPVAKDFDLKSDRNLLAILERGVSEDYFWHEMTLHYQNYVVMAVSNWLYAASIRGDDSARWRRIGLITRNLMFSQLAVRFANMEGPMLNDGLGQTRIPDRSLWGQVWRVVPTKIGISQAASVKSWDTLLDQPPELTGMSSLPPVKSQKFPGLDSVQLVSDGWQVLLHYGQRMATHAHQESLSYDLQYNGVWLFRDPGTVAYGSPLHSKYFRRAQSHTVPLIAREGQMPWPSEGSLISMETTKATVMHKGYQKGHDVDRETWIKGATFNDVVKFSLGAGKRLPVGLTFNTICKVTPGRGLAQVGKDDLGHADAFAYWSDRRQYSAEASIEFYLVCDGGKFLVKLASSDIATAFVATTPTTGKAGEQRTGIFIETIPITKATISVQIVAVSP